MCPRNAYVAKNCNTHKFRKRGYMPIVAGDFNAHPSLPSGSNLKQWSIANEAVARYGCYTDNRDNNERLGVVEEEVLISHDRK